MAHSMGVNPEATGHWRDFPGWKCPQERVMMFRLCPFEFLSRRPAYEHCNTKLPS